MKMKMKMNNDWKTNDNREKENTVYMSKPPRNKHLNKMRAADTQLELETMKLKWKTVIKYFQGK